MDRVYFQFSLVSFYLPNIQCYYVRNPLVLRITRSRRQKDKRGRSDNLSVTLIRLRVPNPGYRWFRVHQTTRYPWTRHTSLPPREKGLIRRSLGSTHCYKGPRHTISSLKEFVNLGSGCRIDSVRKVPIS